MPVPHRSEGPARRLSTQGLISTQVATPPDEGMIQVNIRNDNTRIVRRERTVEVFSHQGPDGSWEHYDASRCEEISRAMKDQGPDGAVQLEGIPFEVRWGARATSSRVATCVEINLCVGCTGRRDGSARINF